MVWDAAAFYTVFYTLTAFSDEDFVRNFGDFTRFRPVLNAQPVSKHSSSPQRRLSF
jgi:hypothetical protein